MLAYNYLKRMDDFLILFQILSVYNYLNVK